MEIRRSRSYRENSFRTSVKRPVVGEMGQINGERPEDLAGRYSPAVRFAGSLDKVASFVLDTRVELGRSAPNGAR